MAGELIGTTRIAVALDTADMELGVKRANEHMASMAAGTTAAYEKMNRGDRRRAESLQRQIDILGLGRQGLLAYNIQMKSVGKVQEDLAQNLVKRNADLAAAQTAAANLTKMRADAEVEASRRIVAARNEEQAAIVRGAKVVADAQSNQSRLAQMRENAADAFGPQMRAQELTNAATTREAGIRQRLAAVMASERGQRLRVAQSYDVTTTAITRSGVAANTSAIIFNKYGISAKQNLAAMRQVPAQITDIFVSLQGGQNPMTVLLQQGGQLKDIFGGVLPAVRALTAGLANAAKALLLNPYVLLATAIGTVAVAAFKGEKETNAYARSLALLGDRAKVTVRDLQLMAVGISDTGTTQGKGAEALVAVVSSGKIAAEQYQAVAEAAINMERATGTAISETVAKFAELATDPVAAVAKLNAEEHFLTLEIYNQIKALQEQGNTQAAATLAMETYADVVNTRAGDVAENLGTLQTAWRDVMNAAKFAWDAMLDVGRPTTSTERIAVLATELKNLEKGKLDFSKIPGFDPVMWDKKIAAKSAAITKLIRADSDENRVVLNNSVKQQANDYAVAQTQLILATKSADEQRAAKIKASRGESNIRAVAADKAGLTALAASIRDNQVAYEKGLIAQGAKKPKSTASIDRAVSRAGLQDIKDDLAEKQAAIQADTRILAAEYSAKLVSQTEYFAKTRVLMRQETAAEEQSVNEQIAYLQQRNVRGKEAIEVERELGKLEAERVKIRAKAASELQVLTFQEQAYNTQRANSLADYAEDLDLGTEAMRDQVRSQIESIGMGQRQFELQSRINQILTEAAAKERDLAKARRDGQISPSEYARQSSDTARVADERVRVEQDAYTQINAAQQDWRSGMRAGLQDWIAQASDVAGQVRSITVSSLDRIAEGFVELALTGKMSYKALLADILTEITKFLMKQAVLEFVKMFAGMMGGANYDFAGDSSWAAAQPNAKGGVYSSPSLSAYSNSIVSQPTPFYFAKGASFGIMGEAGAEAIMPLAKGPDGSLGVKVHGGAGGGGPVSVIIQTNIENGGTSSSTSTQGSEAEMYRKFAERMRSVAQNEITQAMRPNGALWKAGVTA